MEDRLQTATTDGPGLSEAEEGKPSPAERRVLWDKDEVSPGTVPPEARLVVDFWSAAGPTAWFAKDEAFDLRFRERFEGLHEKAAKGELASWIATTEGALALLILLDQFPRNAYRNSPRMYATDGLARAVATTAIALGHDRMVDPMLAVFFCLPFAHSEDLADQERSVALFRDLPPPAPAHSERHRDIIRRFGRFPHRNAILGRRPTAAETAYLAEGGFAG